jgi:tetratricopeptide (TPR) repeat protein
MKRDVRVEVTIPGGTHVYAVSEANEKHAISGIQWNFVFVSSILRSFEPKNSDHIKVIAELDSKELFNDFLIVASNLYKNGYGKKFGEVLDRVKDGSSILLQKIADYFIQKRRINECIDFISPFAEEDPLLIGLICDALFTIDKLKEAITLLAHKINEFPMLASLLLKQAQAFLKYEYYEYALKISKILVDLCPESFECWLVLAESYFHVRKFKSALIAIDVAPSYEDINDELILPELGEYHRTNPKVQNSTNVYSELMVKPQKPDFKFTENSRASNVPLEYEKKVADELHKANSRKLNSCDQKAYELLVKIEKEVSWEVLLKLKSDTFLAEGDEVNGWENPYLNAEYAKHTLDYTHPGKNKTNESFYAIQKSAHMFLREKKKYDPNEGTQEEGIEDQVIKEENIEESKATENREQTLGERKRTRTLAKNEILGKATIEEQPVTFASIPSDGEGEEDDLQEEEQKFNQGDSRKKRLATKIDRLFLMLYEDLNLLIKWENEEKKKIEEKAPEAFNYNGIVWVHRGMLAERISRKRLAEKAYRNAIERGFSMYAWYRLLNIYSETYNPKA